MITFDEIIPRVCEVFDKYSSSINDIQPIIVNRDLNGRVRLIVDESVQNNPDAQERCRDIAAELSQKLGKHAFPKEKMILFENDISAEWKDGNGFSLEGYEGVFVVDRLATEGRWGKIAPVSSGAPRVVFFSIKGGVGRSTSLAATAWSLAQAGKRVMVLDLDLESPGLSSALLPDERRPTFGITDWLVEDLVDNGNVIFDDMVATSELSRDGEILVVPAHGRKVENYISKLGRVWMPKLNADNLRENWSGRLNRLLGDLEERWKPDVMLIDSRSGIDEVASSCVTDLGASLVLLFSIDGEQTWSGYRILFEHWFQADVVRDIRERLQLVGAMIPEINAVEYMDGLREKSWDLFSDTLYDNIPPGETSSNYWNFDEKDENAPHFPWVVKWHRGFAALTSLNSRFQNIDDIEVNSIFGTLIDGLKTAIPNQDQ